MNAAHAHLMLNHVPVLGLAFGLGLLAFGVWRKNDVLKKTALTLFVIAAMVAVPVYLTGEPAEDLAKPLPGVSEAILEQHEETAVYAFAGMVAVGILALGGLLRFRAGKLVPASFAWVVLALSLVVSGVMAWTANLGGQVRHSEIRAGGAQFPITSEPNDD